MNISRAAVLGSGVMGGAIAAHLANCGIPSIMLDIVPSDLSEEDKNDAEKRNSICAASKAALHTTKPPPLTESSNADMIEVGNFDDDMEKISACDWIIEVVTERLNIKQIVLGNVAKHRKPGSIVSSNTSGIPIRSMIAGMDDDMKQHFLGTHFFNPPRYLKLLELIPAPDTLPEVMTFMSNFMTTVLGKGVVSAKDTPNFIANRILTFNSQFIMYEMLKDGLCIEEVDALTGPLIGHSSSATLRTSDLVGIDTLLNVVSNVADNCPNDECIDLMTPPAFLVKMSERGYLGNKSGSGFFKATKERDENGRRIILGLDLDSLEYRDPVKPKFACTDAAVQAETLEEKIGIMHTGDDKGSQFAWKVFSNSAVYAANRIPEMADDIVSIDNACRWGFAWEIGIFETWDVLGFDYVCDRMQKDGLELPPIVLAMKEAGAKGFYTQEKGERVFFDLDNKSYQPVGRQT